MNNCRFLLLTALVLLNTPVDSQDLFFSEYTANGYTNVLEIFNPTEDTVDLSRYSILRDDKARFDFPGGVLLPRETWVGCRNEPDHPPAPEALAAADTSWPAGGSIWYLSSNIMIELLKDDVVIDKINDDPRNGTVAGVEDALDRPRTMIRKRLVYEGETNWDIARGTNADDSQWILLSVSYSDLKHHTYTAPDAAEIWSDEFEISTSGGDKDTIYYVPKDITGNLLMNKIQTVPGAEIDFFRGDVSIDNDVELKNLDELVVWNTSHTKSHTYVISQGIFKDLFISEITIDATRSVIELFNPKDKSLYLNGYSLRMAINDASFPISGGGRYHSLDGIVLGPHQTYLIANKDVPDQVKDSADIILGDDNQVPGDYILHLYQGDDAIALFKEDQIIDIIGKEGSDQIWEVAGVKDATWLKTFIRKPVVQSGNSDWDNVRGYIKESGNTLADSSEWLVLPTISYDNFGKHKYAPFNTPGIEVTRYGTTLTNQKSVFNFGLIKPGETREIKFEVENYGDAELVLDSIWTDNSVFSVSAGKAEVEEGLRENYSVFYTPEVAARDSGNIYISSNAYGDSLFTIALKGLASDENIRDTTYFYLSPEGNDQNTGDSSNNPLRSFEELMRRIRELERPMQFQLYPALTAFDHPVTGSPPDYRETMLLHQGTLTLPVVVNCMPGYYFLDTTVHIDQLIGGNIHFRGIWNYDAENEIRADFNNFGNAPQWLNLPSEKIPVVSGGKRITDWSETSVNGVQAWVSDLPEVAAGELYFRQLFVNGERALRSRWPKQGTNRINEILARSTGEVDARTDRVRLRAGDMKAVKNLNDVEWVGLHRWVDERIPVKSWEESGGILTLAYLPRLDMYSSHPSHKAGLTSYYLDGVYETLSEPGEWYLDKIEGKLYYIPQPGETPENTEIIAPRLQTLFKIQGNSTANEYLWSVTFHRMAFMHTIVDRDAHYDGPNMDSYGEGVISYTGARIPMIKACYFGHVGEPAVEFANGTMGGEIASSVFRDLGSSAIEVCMQSTFVDHTDRNGYEWIHDNDILGYGRFHEGSVAVRYESVVYTLNEHNLIRDGYYGGLSCIHGAGTAYRGYRNTIRKNHIHKVGQGLLSDMGGIYTHWHQVGSLIEGNLVHDIEARDYTAAALYLDKNSSYFQISNNTFYNSNEDLVNMKGHSHLFNNNLLAFSTGAAIHRHKSASAPVEDILGLGETPARLTGNIFIQSGGRMFDEFETREDIQHQVIADSNIYYNYGGQVVMNESQTLGQWMNASGDDTYSISTDPGFHDPFRYNFGFDEEASAGLLGFRQNEVIDAGPRKSVWDADGAVWINYPELVKPDFLPSDNKSLHFWISAKDIGEEMVHKWEDRTYNKFNLYQYDNEMKPELIQEGLNGHPVVRFNGTSWMSSEDKSAQVQGRFGTFMEDNFTVFTIHRSAGEFQPVICKGEQGTHGNWSIGEVQNSFRWADTSFVGRESDEFMIRMYRKWYERYEYYENGRLVDSSELITDVSFNKYWDHFYLGRNGDPGNGLLNGDIAEIIIYKGVINTKETTAVFDYLVEEWDIDTSEIIDTTDINNIMPAGAEIKIYPNPCTDILRIDFDAGIEEIALFNMLGEAEIIVGPGQSPTTTISVAGLKPGVYMLKVKTTDNLIFNHRIIKQ